MWRIGKIGLTPCGARGKPLRAFRPMCNEPDRALNISLALHIRIHVDKTIGDNSSSRAHSTRTVSLESPRYGKYHDCTKLYSISGLGTHQRTVVCAKS